MFNCQNCGEQFDVGDKYCRRCGKNLSDGTEKVAVLLVPTSACVDLVGYMGKWKMVWPARKFSLVCSMASECLSSYHSKGVIVLFEPAMMEGKEIVSGSYILCDILDTEWPITHGERKFELESLEPVTAL